MIDKKLLRDVVDKTIPTVAFKYLKVGDVTELQSFLLEKLATNILPKVDLTEPEKKQLGYIVVSLHGWAKNYFRDVSRPIRLPRGLHDLYNRITAYKRKYPDNTLEELLIDLEICKGEYTEAIESYDIKIRSFEPSFMSPEIDPDSEEYLMIECLDEGDRNIIYDYLNGKVDLDFIDENLSPDAIETMSYIL